MSATDSDCSMIVDYKNVAIGNHAAGSEPSSTWDVRGDDVEISDYNFHSTRTSQTETAEGQFGNMNSWKKDRHDGQTRQLKTGLQTDLL